ncbi:MAG TPA: hypothetical protein VHD63_04650 [Ktedonobacteraceae bacterium]|jgi:hypothetical protein|nr:hypothetical protein [Ktedonobacteraceae bacterium]
MLRLSLQAPAQSKGRSVGVFVLVVLETLLVTIALIPTRDWARLLPNSSTASQDGPFPPAVAIAVPLVLYVIPTLVGFLCRNWQHALFYATLPAWIGLGLFVTAANSKVGIFYLVATDSVSANVGVLELFALLGALGWLAQYIFKPRKAADPSSR